jgi:hypothetical protein
MFSTLERDTAPPAGTYGAARDVPTPLDERRKTSERPRLLLAGLLVDGELVEGDLAVVDEAARRARVEQRPLVVAVARPRIPWSTNALLHAIVADRADARFDDLRRAVHRVCAQAGWSARVLPVGEPCTCTRRGRYRLWRRRLTELARLLDAELHPLAEPPTGSHRRDLVRHP